MRWSWICLFTLGGCATTLSGGHAPGPDLSGPIGGEGTVDGGYEVAGQVIAAGAPFRGAEVLVDGQSVATTDDRGAFRLRTDRVEPWILARAGAQLSGAVHLDGSHPQAGDLLLALGKPSSLRGEVRDAQTEKPIAGARVVVDDARTAVTDAAGTFDISAFSGNGDDLVSIVADGHAAYQTRVDLSLRREVSAVFELEPGRNARIQVKDGEGRPIGGAQVIVTDGDSHRVYQTRRAAADGSVTLENLPMGLLLAKATAQGWSGLASPVSGDLVTLTLRPEARFEGRVLAADRRPVEGARVHLRMTEPGNAEAASPTRADGTFAIEGLAAGTYHLSAIVPGRAAVDLGTVDLTEGEHRSGDWSLSEGPTLEGRVTDAQTGQPIPGARVGLAGATAEITPAVCDAEGKFELTLASLDPIRLRVEAEGYVSRELPGRAGDPAAIGMERGITIRGRVVDALGGAVQGASLDDDEATGPDGRFEIHRPTVTERVAFARFGSLGAEVALSPVAGIGELGDVALRDGILVHIQVLDPSGAPAAGAEVFGAGDSPLPRREILRGALPQIGVTDAQGITTLRVAPIKSCAVAVKPAWAPSSAEQCPLELSLEGQTARLQLQSPAWLEGVMTRSQPGPDRAVSSDESPSAIPDAAGRYRVGPLSPGHHDFFAFDGYSNGHPQRVWFWQADLTAGQSTSHAFGDPHGGVLEVEVHHLRAHTVMVGLLREESQGRGEATMIFVEPQSGTAKARLPDVPPGDYKLAVSDGMETGASRMLPITIQARQTRTQSLDYDAMLPVAPSE